ncbi:MAG: hypothetical protein KIT80_18165 [Chitinophagaceae bacterium]|nr:hypothetical protein [Chitinophagaceae bacterium]MCW5928851.1 hypothetical protein [Chitinophagaceae bacterium]
MISIFNSFLLIGLICSGYTKNDITEVKATCNELGLYFMLPTGFTSLDSSAMEALSQRGEKAVNKTFNRESLRG